MPLDKLKEYVIIKHDSTVSSSFSHTFTLSFENPDGCVIKFVNLIDKKVEDVNDEDDVFPKKKTVIIVKCPTLNIEQPCFSGEETYFNDIDIQYVGGFDVNTTSPHIFTFYDLNDNIITIDPEFCMQVEFYKNL